MGKKGWWFSVVKKVFSPELKEKTDQKTTQKLKKKWFSKHKSADAVSLSEEATDAVPASFQTTDERKSTGGETGQNRHACSVVHATSVATGAAIIAAQAAAEVVCLTTISHYSAKSEEEIAAIKIQTAFRRQGGHYGP